MSNRIVFKVSAESALNLDGFIKDDLPKALEFLNCLECASGLQCEFVLETESAPLPRIPEIEVDLRSAESYSVFSEAFTDALKGQHSGFSGYVAPDVANKKELLEAYLRGLGNDQWSSAFEKGGGVNLISGELLSGSSGASGGDIF